MRSERLERKFPKLLTAGYDITSPEDVAYNCIAWAAHDIHRPWWPAGYGYWPRWIEPEETIECFIRAFRLLGYSVCEDSRREFGYRKVVLYALENSPKHMARQLPDGAWTSKLGQSQDITHFTLDAVEAYGPEPFYGEYGSPVVFMKRLVAISWLVRAIQFIDRKVLSSSKYAFLVSRPED